jgi:hypothetical protein
MRRGLSAAAANGLQPVSPPLARALQELPGAINPARSTRRDIGHEGSPGGGARSARAIVLPRSR